MYVMQYVRVFIDVIYACNVYCFHMQRGCFSKSDVDRLTTHAQKKDYIGVDIFLSTDWPSDVTMGTNPPVIPLMLTDCNN